MSDRVVRIRLMILLILGMFGVFVWLPGSFASGQPPINLLTVTFFDVGQGDAIFIETPDGVQVLIDGGPDGSVVRELSRAMDWSDRTIDLLVGTHPDLDHIGGLIDVLERYEVATILTTENTGDSFAASAYDSLIDQEGAAVVNARAGQVFQLGASTTLTVFSPSRDPAQLESNASSIVVQLRYGDIEFMLTGDAPQGIEDYLVGTVGANLESEVLKLGHHGSNTSSSELFLATVEPQFAIVSAGTDNRYGHPHEEVVKRAGGAGAQLLSTQTFGSITFVTDGREVWLAE